ncbi:MAG: GNAT family N-acetyltransferase [Aerococcus sp.]|nr:GNAT family N-acetyltransferase [Aerococcus sp.]
MKREEMEIILVDASAKYAKPLLEFYQAVGKESEFLSFDEAGLSVNQEQEERYLKSIHGSWNQRLLLALLDDEIIGAVSVGIQDNIRTQHVGELGIVIRRKFWGMGLSRVLMSDMIDWAVESPILRYLTLSVDETNLAATTLYQHYDFEEIGRIPLGTQTSQGYHDQIIMGRFVLAEEE